MSGCGDKEKHVAPLPAVFKVTFKPEPLFLHPAKHASHLYLCMCTLGGRKTLPDGQLEATQATRGQGVWG